LAKEASEGFWFSLLVLLKDDLMKKHYLIGQYAIKSLYEEMLLLIGQHIRTSLTRRNLAKLVNMYHLKHNDGLIKKRLKLCKSEVCYV
jgi:hypothetical protein